MSGHSNILLSYGAAAAGNGLLTNLEAYWKLDDASATQTDSHASYDGTITGATHSATGILNNAVSFDGSGDYINMGDVLDFDYNQPFSLSTWVDPAAIGSNMVIIGKYDTGRRGYFVYITTTGYIQFTLRSNDTSNFMSVTTNASPLAAAGGWYNIGVSYDGSASASGAIIYINGASVSKVATNDTLSATTVSTANFTLGMRDFTGSQLYFNGIMDETGVWSRELSATDFSNLYNGGAGLAYSSFTS